MHTSITSPGYCVFFSLLCVANIALGQSKEPATLWPFPLADYSYPTTGYPVAEPADEQSTAGTWRYPVLTQPPVVGLRYSFAGFDTSAAPADLNIPAADAKSIASAPTPLDEAALTGGQREGSTCHCAEGLNWFDGLADLFKLRD